MENSAENKNWFAAHKMQVIIYGILIVALVLGLVFGAKKGHTPTEEEQATTDQNTEVSNTENNSVSTTGHSASWYKVEADVYLKDGNYDSALKSVIKSLELDNSDPEAWYIKSEIHEKKGEYVLALSAIKDALAFDSENTVYQNWQATINTAYQASLNK